MESLNKGGKGIRFPTLVGSLLPIIMNQQKQDSSKTNDNVVSLDMFRSVNDDSDTSSTVANQAGSQTNDNEISLDLFGMTNENSNETSSNSVISNVSKSSTVTQAVSQNTAQTQSRPAHVVSTLSNNRSKSRRKLTMKEQLRERDNSIFKNKPILDDDLIGLLLTKASDEQRNMEYKPFYDRFGNLAGYIPVPNQTLRR